MPGPLTVPRADATNSAAQIRLINCSGRRALRTGESMKRREFLFSATAIAAMPRRLMAQSAPKAARIGWLTAQNEASLTPYLVVMRKGFADLGYIEGRNLTIEYRY